MTTPTTETTGTKLYAVFRNGFRVSNSDYESETLAYPEYAYWVKLLKRWPDGSRLHVRELHYQRTH